MDEELNTPIPVSHYGFIYHYYRAEVYRETNWRNRLDVTTNWSIVSTAAFLSFAFSNEHIPHSVILINYLLVWYFLYIESRRFRYYSLLKERTRQIEQYLLSDVFTGKIPPQHVWAKKIIDSFKKPRVKMSRLESIAWRLRRSYIFMFLLLFMAWLAKIQTFPTPAYNINDLLSNAKLWVIPGQVVLISFLTIVATTILLAFYLPQKSSEDDLP